MKKFFAIGLFALLLVPSMAMAAEFRSSENGDLTIGANDTTKNLYAASSNGIVTNSLIGGDLMAAGQTISIKEGTENNLFAAGKDIDVSGAIGKNVRVAATNININGNVGEDVLAFGQAVKINKDAVIKGDLVAAGSDLTINGTINGNVKCTGTTIVINGEILGDVNIGGVTSLTVGADAKIDGKLTYSSSKEGSISDQASIKNGLVYTKSSDSSAFHSSSNVPGTGTLFGFLISLTTVIVLVVLLPKWSKSASETVASNFAHRLLWGFVALILLPIASFILMMTLLGIKLGFILLMVYLGLLVVAAIFSPVFAGSIFFRAFQRGKKDEFRVDWATASIGVLALWAIDLLPVIGWVIVFAFFLASLGQLSIGIWESVRAQRS